MRLQQGPSYGNNLTTTLTQGIQTWMNCGFNPQFYAIDTFPTAFECQRSWVAVGSRFFPKFIFLDGTFFLRIVERSDLVSAFKGKKLLSSRSCVSSKWVSMYCNFWFHSSQVYDCQKKGSQLCKTHCDQTKKSILDAPWWRRFVRICLL